MIYFVQAEGGGPIKIGHANDVDARLSGLQCGNPNLLIARRVIPGDRWLERDLHNEFADYRIRGEWFDAVPELARRAHGWEGFEPEQERIQAERQTRTEAIAALARRQQFERGLSLARAAGSSRELLPIKCDLTKCKGATA